MVALIDPAMYGRFKALRARMLEDKIGKPAKVLVPIGASPATSGRPTPRVLFVGKATSGWTEERLDSFDGSRSRAEDVVRDLLPTGGTAFWQFAREVLRQTLHFCEIEAADAELPSYCGWSNLVKIGETCSGYTPPGDESLRRQKSLCIEALRMEIKRIRPTAVVLTTQDYAKYEIVLPLFGGAMWRFDTPQQDSVAFKFHTGFNTTLIWTNHPQGMRPPGSRARVQSLVADLIARTVLGRSLPRSA
jgi:hypothetical protein